MSLSHLADIVTLKASSKPQAIIMKSKTAKWEFYHLPFHSRFSLQQILDYSVSASLCFYDCTKTLLIKITKDFSTSCFTKDSSTVFSFLFPFYWLSILAQENFCIGNVSLALKLFYLFRCQLEWKWQISREDAWIIFFTWASIELKKRER